MSGKDRARVHRSYRATLAAYAGAFCGLLLAEVTTRGHAAVFSVLLFVLAIGLQTYVIRRSRRIEAAANRTHPDYIAIAAMEREVYGETFRHEGSIASMFLPPELNPLVTPEVPPGLVETIIETRRERHTRPGSDRDESFWLHIDEARRLTGQIRTAQPSDTTEPATLEQYLAWLNGYIKRGGKPTHFYDYPIGRLRFRYAVGAPLIVDSDREFGAGGRSVIVARGVTAERTNPAGLFGGWAHTRLYFMDGYRSNDPGIVPVYSNPEFDAIRERFALRDDGHLSNLRWERPSTPPTG